MEIEQEMMLHTHLHTVEIEQEMVLHIHLHTGVQQGAQASLCSFPLFPTFVVSVKEALVYLIY